MGVTVSTGEKKHSRDRRIVKTQTALKKALAALLIQKKIQDISIKELTDLADVNRGTFYLHYKDVFDLLEQTEDDLLNDLRATLDSFTTEKIRNDSESVFEAIYQIGEKNSDMTRILLSENGDIKFMGKLKTLVRTYCLKDWSKILKQQNMKNFDAYYSFVVGGCVALFQYWFDDGMKETTRELAEITVSFLHRTAVNPV